MKKFLLLFFILFLPAWSFAQTTFEDEVLHELNLARAKPDVYKGYLEASRANYHGREYRMSSGVRLVTKEGVRAVDEAIRFLGKQKPIGKLVFSEGLRDAALDLALAEGPTGNIGHSVQGMSVRERAERHGKWERIFGENISYGPDRAREVVSQLIIDDGVPGRGHRKNIFNPAFKVVGIACGPHKRFVTMCVMDFAGGFK